MDLITQAADLLNKGKLVAFPTETVYGLGAIATSDTAVASIYKAKGRPSFNPLIAHVSSIEMAKKYVKWNEMAEALAKAFWPGPLTLVLPRRSDCKLSYLISAGLETVAIRMPNHPMALELIEKTGIPIAAPSANKSGSLSPTTPQHVADSLGKNVDLILKGGACKIGVESTVLLVDKHPTLLRFGGILPAQIEQVIGQKVRTFLTDETAPRSPGQSLSHYAPCKPLRINAKRVKKDEVLLGFGPVKCFLNLSPTGSLQEASANLFAFLHQLDKDKSIQKIAVSPIPQKDLGLAINDRLKRAAHR